MHKVMGAVFFLERVGPQPGVYTSFQRDLFLQQQSTTITGSKRFLANLRLVLLGILWQFYFHVRLVTRLLSGISRVKAISQDFQLRPQTTSTLPHDVRFNSLNLSVKSAQTADLTVDISCRECAISYTGGCTRRAFCSFFSS